MFEVISPDAIPIGPEAYVSQEEAEAALFTWCKRYERQGFYSSLNFGRIPIQALPDFCCIKAIDE